MKLTEDDLERSVSGVLSRFGIDKDEARKVRRQLSHRLSEDKEEQKEPDEKYHAYFINRFGLTDLAVDDILMPSLNVVEQVLYRRFYRLAYCYGRTWCQVSGSDLQKACNISSMMTVRKGIKGLQKSHAIKVITPAIQRKPPVYRVYLPCEMPQFSGEEFPTSVIFIKEKPNPQEIRELINSQPEFSSLKISPLKVSTLEELRQLINSTLDTKFSMLNFRGQTSKPSPNNGLHDQKKDKKSPINNIINNLKTTLSPAGIISSFYEGIGQTKITKEKRARAEKNFKELQKDGFSIQDIQFAVEWTLKNPKKDFYDFSIIKHTIGAAVAAREKAEAEEAKRLEQERIALEKQAEEERQEKEKSRLESYKESLSTDEKAKLREKALDEIRKMSDVKEEFINDILIDFKENEILRRGFAVIKPKTDVHF